MEGMMLENPFLNRHYPYGGMEETATAAMQRAWMESLKPPIWEGVDLKPPYGRCCRQKPLPLTEKIKRRTWDECNDAVFGVPASVLMPGEIDLQELVGEITEMEEIRMERSLAEGKFKKVTIECEDGRTYSGEVVRITGCPFDYSSMAVEARISKKEIGTYSIEKVLFQNPATIVFWTDGTKTVVNCMDNAETKRKVVDGKEVIVRRARKCDTYSEEVGLAMAIAKKWAGNQGAYNNIFRKFIPGMKEAEKAEKKAEKAAKKVAEG